MSKSFTNSGISDSEADSKAYTKGSRVFLGNLSKQEVADYYTNWAWDEDGDYDSQTNAARFTSPEETARRVTDYFSESERPNVRILDVAAGTGRVGVAVLQLINSFTAIGRYLHHLDKLYNDGFRHIDALDPSEGMLRKAKTRGVYTNYLQDFVGGGHKVPVDDGHYDAIACSGGMGEGHIPASAMDEMIRIVQPGGLICITTREEFFLKQPEYQRRIDQLVAVGKWKFRSKEILDNYFLHRTGYTFQMIVI